jgi:hypothetical protein
MTERKTVYANANGVRRTLISDSGYPDRVIVQTEQVLDEILNGIMRDRERLAANDNRSSIKPIARIPVEVFERMILEGWGPDDEAKWLNSPEAAPFRIWKGRV